MYSTALALTQATGWPVWILVNYFAWKGLANFGFSSEAAVLRDKTLLLLSKHLVQSGSRSEYYHPDTGAALSLPGFMDWNLLVSEML
jgi:hypothetical protein